MVRSPGWACPCRAPAAPPPQRPTAPHPPPASRPASHAAPLLRAGMSRGLWWVARRVLARSGAAAPAEHPNSRIWRPAVTLRGWARPSTPRTTSSGWGAGPRGLTCRQPLTRCRCRTPWRPRRPRQTTSVSSPPQPSVSALTQQLTCPHCPLTPPRHRHSLERLVEPRGHHHVRVCGVGWVSGVSVHHVALRGEDVVGAMTDLSGAAVSGDPPRQHTPHTRCPPWSRSSSFPTTTSYTPFRASRQTCTGGS